jgi:prephenate dehydrogenase
VRQCQPLRGGCAREAGEGVTMRIAVIGGTGKEGGGMALRWARAGHAVFLGSRDAARAQAVAA